MHGIVGLLIAMVVSLPPLTEAQRTQMDTADDALGQWDTAALYPLLDNAAQWDEVDPAALVPGAIIADYAGIRAAPAQHRGRVIILEGQFVEALPQSLLRPGAWGETVTRWVVQIGPLADDKIVVYLTHPPPPPRLGAPVRLPARFYKLWPSHTRIEGDPVTYLLFVGHSAAVLDEPSRAAPRTGSGGGPKVAIGVMVAVVVAGFFFMLRRLTRLSLTPRPLPSQLRRQHDAESRGGRGEPRPVEEAEESDGPPLPDNPADALAELERRHEAGGSQ